MCRDIRGQGYLKDLDWVDIRCPGLACDDYGGFAEGPAIFGPKAHVKFGCYKRWPMKLSRCTRTHMKKDGRPTKGLSRGIRPLIASSFMCARVRRATAALAKVSRGSSWRMYARCLTSFSPTSWLRI